MLKFLDIFFVVFHTALVIFNLFGWIFKKTRLLNLVTLLLTGLSWFVLGLFYGMGYCPFTDWHFSILEKMGKEISSTSYIQYLIDRLFDVWFSRQLVDRVTLISYIVALILSVYMNLLRRYFPFSRKP
jgi:hypothetical protein